jgi:hypothetical protein
LYFLKGIISKTIGALEKEREGKTTHTHTYTHTFVFDSVLKTSIGTKDLMLTL